MASNTAFQGAYSSFSGVDIKAVFGNKVVAELQGASYNITREKAPVYTMGQADARSFSRGKRGIAGSLIFMVFDRSALLSTMRADDQQFFLSDVDDIRPADSLLSSQDVVAARAVVQSAAAIGVGATSTRALGSDVSSQESEIAGNLFSDQAAAKPWYADQILPFDITFAAANEYGALAVMRIYGVEILNEGYGISVDDVQSATQMTYVARTIIGWTSLGKHDAFK